VLLKKGEVLLPEMLAKGMQLKTGDTVVLVANNKDGSVNGMTFKVAGVVESLMGPGGRDGYMHIARRRPPCCACPSRRSARWRFASGTSATWTRWPPGLRAVLEPMKNKKGKPMFELHTWDSLPPFTTWCA
jgi:putative ABC transport system permease protein